jgi:itaconyl-CoA hydratase
MSETGTAMPGEVIAHARRRTLTQQDNTWFTLLTLNTAPHFDVTSPSFEQFGGVLMNSCVTLGVIQGLCQPEFGEDLLPNRHFGEVRLTSPVHPGDTLSAESKVLNVEEFADGRRALHVRTAGRKQTGETVITFDRWYVRAPEGAWSVESRMRSETAPRVDPDRAFANAIVGPRFGDFTPGDRYNHGFGRTMLADENIWYSVLHHNANPLNIDQDHASRLDPRGLVIDDNFVLSTVTGMGVKHTTQNALANLGWKNVRFHAPMFAGDTLFSETLILAKRESGSSAGQGIVSVETTGRNQHGQVVLTFERAFLFGLD